MRYGKTTSREPWFFVVQVDLEPLVSWSGLACAPTKWGLRTWFVFAETMEDTRRFWTDSGAGFAWVAWV